MIPKKYPIKEYYMDENLYKLVKEEEFQTITTRKIKPINEDSYSLFIDVISSLEKKYSFYDEYLFIDVEDNGKHIGEIALRISDQSIPESNLFNENVDRFNKADYAISVIICNYDIVNDRFIYDNKLFESKGFVEMYFNSDNSAESIIDKIEKTIERYKNDLIINLKTK